MMQLPVTDIAQLIPQKHPFVLISELVYTDGHTARSRFSIPEDHVMLSDGKLTEGGLLENVAQTAAVSAGFMALNSGQNVKEGYIAAVKNLEIFDLPATGETITTNVTLLESVAGMNIVSGRITRGEYLLAQCELRIMLKEDAE